MSLSTSFYLTGSVHLARRTRTETCQRWFVITSLRWEGENTKTFSALLVKKFSWLQWDSFISKALEFLYTVSLEKMESNTAAISISRTKLLVSDLPADIKPFHRLLPFSFIQRSIAESLGDTGIWWHCFPLLVMQEEVLWTDMTQTSYTTQYCQHWEGTGYSEQMTTVQTLKLS